jgi:hypothetical protein
MTGLLVPPVLAADPFEGDPDKSHPWPDMRREFLDRDARVRFGERVYARPGRRSPRIR